KLPFHAKNVILKGRNSSFLLAGSANASVAAFGTGNHNSLNEEACILYQSSKIDFLKQLGIRLSGAILHPAFSSAYQGALEGGILPKARKVFIRTAEQQDDLLFVAAYSPTPLSGTMVTFSNSKG